MVGKLIKQPNGKYCIIDYADDVRRYNLTEADIVSMYIEEAQAHIVAAEHYGNLIARTADSNNIPDDMLKEMGFNKTYKELVKFVPRKPINQSYADCDFTTYGKCPNCGNIVRDGMGWTDKECECGQMLKW